MKRFIVAWLSLLFASFVAGCASTGDSAVSSPQAAINEIRIISIAAARQIKAQVKAGNMSAARAQGYLNQIKHVDAKADMAQNLLDAGKPGEAMTTVNLLKAALLALQKQIAQKANEEA